MPAGEVLWRASNAASIPVDWLRAHFNSPPPANPRLIDRSAYPLMRCQTAAPFETFRVFDLEFAADAKLEWHHDYRHAKDAPRGFAPRLDIRDPEKVGDIKYIWEINRHQHLTALASSGYPKGAQIAARELKRWLNDNPYLYGVNWTSPLELGLRLISWALLYPSIEDELERDSQFFAQFSASIYNHLTYLSRHRSRYSSANNHLIGELAGLLVGSLCFPWWKECGSWARQAVAELEREAGLQFVPDGVNREQAISYQLFTLEMMLAAAQVSANCNLPFNAQFHQRLYHALCYLEALATSESDLPWFGDSDDARGFILDPRMSPLESVMELGGSMYCEPRFLRLAHGNCTAQAFRIDMASSAKPLVRSELVPTQFTEGGVAILRHDSWKVLMDVGPLGYTSIAAHGHADALSVLLADESKYILVDPGTYAYHSNQEWRDYFRGSSAHNTIRIDGQNQSEIAGRFLWGQQAHTILSQCSDEADLGSVVAEHDGYTKLADPVVHRRKLLLDKHSGVLTISDTLQCKGTHRAEIFWHLSEDAQARPLSSDTLEISVRGKVLRMEIPATASVDILSGSENPIAGWRSPAFHVKHPIQTIRCGAQISGNAELITRIHLGCSDEEAR
jgi:hypothetical protein